MTCWNDLAILPFIPAALKVGGLLDRVGRVQGQAVGLGGCPFRKQPADGDGPVPGDVPEMPLVRQLLAVGLQGPFRPEMPGPGAVIDIDAGLEPKGQPVILHLVFLIFEQEMRVERAADRFVPLQLIEDERIVLVPVRGLPLEVGAPAAGRLSQHGPPGFQFHLILLVEGCVLEIRFLPDPLSFHLGGNGEPGSTVTQQQRRFAPHVEQGVDGMSSSSSLI